MLGHDDVHTAVDTLTVPAVGTASTSVTTIAQSFQQAVSTAIANAMAIVGASKCSNCAAAGR